MLRAILDVVGPRRGRTPRRIAFVKHGSFSHVNSSLLDALAKRLPGCRLDTIEVSDLISRWEARNILRGGLEYLPAIIAGSARYKRQRLLERNSYYARTLHRRVREKVAAGGYDLSIQTQSLWDGSTPGVPHLVYTDHTHLANLRYRLFDRRELCSDAWIGEERSCYLNAARILVTSHFTQQSLEEDYGCDAARIDCVYSAANFELPPADEPRDPDAKSILFVGFDWERKGGPRLLEAFERVRRTHPDATLTVIGRAPSEPVANCTFIARVDRQALSSYYRRAAIYCMPSEVEPSAGSLSEAAAHRVPVVSTHVGGTPDRVLDGETGYLVAPGDVAQLAAALERLLANPALCAAFGEAGRRRVLEYFTWDRVADRVTPHILACLGD